MPRLSGSLRGALAIALLLTCSSGISEQERGSNADMSNAPRVAIDRPKPTFMLMERDKRIHGLRPFQDLVDKAPAGSVLKPPPGHYAGPVTIDKTLTIDGGGKVIIDAGDRGTVMVLNASNSVLRGLHLTGSGDSHDTDDSCLDVRGNNNLIEHLKIDNCLFGIDLKQSSDNIVRHNTIRSKDLDLGVRGDGLRLWYSNNNLIEKNEIIDSRDMVARLVELCGFRLYESDNLFESMQSMADFVFFSGALRALAQDLIRISNDLRLLASGPRTGFGEIELAAVQPGYGNTAPLQIDLDLGLGGGCASYLTSDLSYEYVRVNAEYTT